MTKYEKRSFRKARSLVSWSFLGILNPLVGVILAGIGKSMLRDIPDQDDDDDEFEINAVIDRSNVSIGLSIISFIIGTVISIAVLLKSSS